jgi:hypothetical protein
MAEPINFQALLAAIPQTVIRVITKPAEFFREMPKTGGYFDPLVFVVVLGTVAGIIQTVVNTILYFSVMGVTAILGSLIFMPIMIALFSFVGAGILFLIWKLMGSQENYEVAYRGAAYLAALSPITTVIGLIPYLGTVISLVIMLYYLVIVSTEVHGIPSKKAWLVFGIIAAVIGLFSLIATYSARKFSREMGIRSQQMEDASRSLQKQAELMQRQAEQAQRSQQAAQSANQQKQIQDMQKMIEDLQRQQKR